jgi:hypothetical protein
MRQNAALVQRSLDIMNDVIRVLKSALPHTDGELIGGMAANLLDLWETGQKLDKQLKSLRRLRFPEDRERLRNTLLWVEAIQLDMGAFWIAQVKKDIPKLLRALDKVERTELGKNKGKRQTTG